MSADGTTHAPQAEVSDRAADQSQRAALAADTGRQRSDVHVRQPAEARPRQDHADAMLAAPPGRAQETAARSAPDGHASRQTERTSPERASKQTPDVGKHTEHRAESRTRQETADAMLASPPGRVHETAARGGGHDSRRAEQTPSERGPGSGPATAEARGGHGAECKPAEHVSGGKDQVGGEAQPRAEAQGGAAGMSGADRAISSEPHPVPWPEADVAPADAERDQGGTWPPPQADRDRARALYEEDFGGKDKAADPSEGRDRGINVVGDKPRASPGDTSELPPTGKELAEPDEKDATRAEKRRNLFDRDFGDIDDSVKNMVTTVQQIMDQPPPSGHPGVVVDTQPQWGPESVPNAAPDIGNIAELGLVLGVLSSRTFGYVRHKVAEMREGATADASH